MTAKAGKQNSGFPAPKNKYFSIKKFNLQKI